MRIVLARALLGLSLAISTALAGCGKDDAGAPPTPTASNPRPHLPKDMKERVAAAIAKSTSGAKEEAAEADREMAARWIPDLLASMKGASEKTVKTAAEALGAMGERSVPALKDAMSNADAQVRLGAAWALAKVGPPAKAALPELEAALKDSNLEVRAAAKAALDKIR